MLFSCFQVRNWGTPVPSWATWLVHNVNRGEFKVRIFCFKLFLWSYGSIFLHRVIFVVQVSTRTRLGWTPTDCGLKNSLSVFSLQRKTWQVSVASKGSAKFWWFDLKRERFDHPHVVVNISAGEQAVTHQSMCVFVHVCVCVCVCVCACVCVFVGVSVAVQTAWNWHLCVCASFQPLSFLAQWIPTPKPSFSSLTWNPVSSTMKFWLFWDRNSPERVSRLSPESSENMFRGLSLDQFNNPITCCRSWNGDKLQCPFCFAREADVSWNELWYQGCWWAHHKLV